MKNCDEMVNSLLERRDKYVAQQRKRTATLIGVSASLCCVCLAALLGFGMWQVGVFDVLPPNESSEEDTHKSKQTQTHQTFTNDTIVVNRIEAISAYKLKNDFLKKEDHIDMTLDQMNAYYGVNVVPTVPADILPWEEQKGRIYRRDGGTGDVYWDQNLLNFSNDDFTRSVHLEFAKGKYPLIDYLTFSATKTSVIKGTDVLIGMTEGNWYYAKFMHKNVGFVLNAEGVTQDEFVSIVASLLQ